VSYLRSLMWKIPNFSTPYSSLAEHSSHYSRRQVLWTHPAYLIHMVMLLEQMDVLYLQDHLPESIVECEHAKWEKEGKKQVRDYSF